MHEEGQPKELVILFRQLLVLRLVCFLNIFKHLVERFLECFPQPLGEVGLHFFGLVRGHGVLEFQVHQLAVDGLLKKLPDESFALFVKLARAFSRSSGFISCSTVARISSASPSRSPRKMQSSPTRARVSAGWNSLEAALPEFGDGDADTKGPSGRSGTLLAAGGTLK